MTFVPSERPSGIINQPPDKKLRHKYMEKITSSQRFSQEAYKVFADADNLKGVKKDNGEVIVPARYDEIKCHVVDDKCFAFAAIATKDDKDYLIGEDGNAVFEADEIRPNSGSIIPALFKSDDKWGLVNSRGEVILQAGYDTIKPDSNGFYYITLNGKHGLITPFGEVIEPIFDDIELDADDYIVVMLNGKKGYLDEEGEFTEDRKEAYYNMNISL